MCLKLQDVRLWTPESPTLYWIKLHAGEDSVKSYFAARTVSIVKGKAGYNVTALNGQPYMCLGVLDQGYWPDSICTPCEEAMLFDIQSMKDLGFNMLRKHIKIEPLRFYYLCDKIGMLVQQDMVSGGDASQKIVVEAVKNICNKKVDDSN